jgi:hypothetical protein
MHGRVPSWIVFANKRDKLSAAVPPRRPALTLTELLRMDTDRAEECFKLAAACEARAAVASDAAAKRAYEAARECWRELAQCWSDLRRPADDRY